MHSGRFLPALVLVLAACGEQGSTVDPIIEPSPVGEYELAAFRIGEQDLKGGLGMFFHLNIREGGYFSAYVFDGVSFFNQQDAGDWSVRNGELNLQFADSLAHITAWVAHSLRFRIGADSLAGLDSIPATYGGYPDYLVEAEMVLERDPDGFQGWPE